MIYLSGPMAGIMEENHPAFHEAAADLRDRGFAVINPAESLGGLHGLPRREYMRLDFHYLLSADRLVLLPGWRDSEGAKIEVLMAKALDLGVYEYKGLGMRPRPLRTLPSGTLECRI